MTRSSEVTYLLTYIAAGHGYNQFIGPVRAVAHHSLPTSSARSSAGIGGVVNVPEENGGLSHDNRLSKDLKLSRITEDNQYSHFTIPISATMNASASTSHQEDRAAIDQTETRHLSGDRGGCCSVVLNFALAYTQQADPWRETVASFRCSKCRSECSVITNPRKTEGENCMSE